MVGRQVAWSPYNFASDDEVRPARDDIAGAMTAPRQGGLVRPAPRRRALGGRSVKLSEQVICVLAERIVNGAIGSGVLPPTEQDICAEFGVSKTTAREVIAGLAGRGLVTVRHGRRMEIRPVAEWNHLDPLLLELNHDPASVRRTLGDLHDLRMLLEPEIAARAALSATGEQLERIARALERMGELEDDPDAYLELDVDFHGELAAATGNVVLAFVLDSVRELLRVSRRVTNLVGTMPDATLAHGRIYDARAAREPERARQAMRAHLLTVTEVWSPGGPTTAIEAVIAKRRMPAAPPQRSRATHGATRSRAANTPTTEEEVDVGL
jgi:DNA-binding FadR family transcriptional regulator